ncbi:MAG: diguanylate cyclase [bacterium]
MDFRLTRDEKIYVFGRFPYLFCIAALVYAKVMPVPLDLLTLAVISVAWILLSTILGLSFFSRNVAFFMHTIDLIFLGYIVLNNNGTDCPLVFLMPLYTITTAVFSGKGYAIVMTGMVAIFDLFLLFASGRMIFIHGAFWAVYGAGSLSLSFYLATIKEVQDFKMLYFETEKREKYLEKNISKLEEKMNSQSLVDEATGLKNFRYFRERIETEIKRARRQKYIFSLCVLSIDGLEEFKHRYNATERDIVLVRIKKQLEQALRDTDLISRFQSNQFLFLLPDTEPRKAIIPLRRLCDKLSTIGFGKSKLDRFSFSFGIAGFPQDASDVSGLLSLASAALQRSQQRGENLITLASSITKNLSGV